MKERTMPTNNAPRSPQAIRADINSALDSLMIAPPHESRELAETVARLVHELDVAVTVSHHGKVSKPAYEVVIELKKWGDFEDMDRERNGWLDDSAPMAEGDEIVARGERMRIGKTLRSPTETEE